MKRGHAKAHVEGEEEEPERVEGKQFKIELGLVLKIFERFTCYIVNQELIDPPEDLLKDSEQYELKGDYFVRLLIEFVQPHLEEYKLKLQEDEKDQQIEEGDAQIGINRLLKSYFKLSLALCSFQNAFDKISNVILEPPVCENFKFDGVISFLIQDLETTLEDEEERAVKDYAYMRRGDNIYRAKNAKLHWLVFGEVFRARAKYQYISI